MIVEVNYNIKIEKRGEINQSYRIVSGAAIVGNFNNMNWIPGSLHGSSSTSDILSLLDQKDTSKIISVEIPKENTADSALIIPTS